MVCVSVCINESLYLCKLSVFVFTPGLVNAINTFYWWNKCLLRAKSCSRVCEMCVCKRKCVFIFILHESAPLRPLHPEQWLQLCCVSPCWQMIQWLYCESIVKLLSRLLSQWIHRNRLTKLLHFVLDTFCNRRHVCYLSNRCSSREVSSKTGIKVVWRNM